MSKLSLLNQAYDARTRATDRRASLISRYVYRPTSILLTLPFIYLGFSANQVTFLRIPVALLSAYLFAIGSPYRVLLGSVLFAIGTLMDYVDGNLARYYGTAGMFGAALDGAVHVIERTLMPMAVAVGLQSHPDTVCDMHPLRLKTVLVLGAFGSITGFLRTSLSLWQLFRVRQPQQAISADRGYLRTICNQPSPAASFDGMRRYKWAVRRAMNEISHFADALGVVLFAVLRLMSVYLLLIAVVSLFVLRDELGGLLPKGPQSNRARITPERKE